MSDERERPQTKEITLTHKQLGIGTGIAGLLIALTPIKEWFFTREEGVSLHQQIVKISNDMSTAKEEMLHGQERLADKIIERFKEAEDRENKMVDRLERRLDNLELLERTGKMKVRE